MGSVKLPVQCHNGSATQAHVLLKGTRRTLHLPPASLASQLKGGEESSMVALVLVVCLQIMIINFKPATFISESTIEGATEGTGVGII